MSPFACGAPDPFETPHTVVNPAAVGAALQALGYPADPCLDGDGVTLEALGDFVRVRIGAAAHPDPASLTGDLARGVAEHLPEAWVWRPSWAANVFDVRVTLAQVVADYGATVAADGDVLRIAIPGRELEALHYVAWRAGRPPYSVIPWPSEAQLTESLAFNCSSRRQSPGEVRVFERWGSVAGLADAAKHPWVAWPAIAALFLRRCHWSGVLDRASELALEETEGAIVLRVARDRGAAELDTGRWGGY